ncbi:unnamed protein product [Rhizophagus irregularis]|nr:unnamed protein product [Rhizophagus irregularis]
MVSVLAVDWRLGMNWYRSLRFLGQLLSFYSVHPTCNTIRGSRIDAHLETLTLTSGLRIWIQNFFLWIYLTMALDLNFLFAGCFNSTAYFILYRLELSFE